MKIENRRIILTGAASGIGRALLEALCRIPCHILAADRNGPALAGSLAALEGCPAQLSGLEMDLSNSAGVDALFDEAQARMNGVDICIANAGFAYYEKITQPDWAHIETIYRLNVFSAIYSLEKLQLLAAGHDFRMVMIASGMSHLAVPGYAIYGSTKAALDRFAEGLRYELARPEQLMLVYPIATRTNFFQQAAQKTPVPFPSQTPEIVAAAILRGIRRDRRRVYPSAIFSFILLLDRFLPLTRRLYQAHENKVFKQWQQGQN